MTWGGSVLAKLGGVQALVKTKNQPVAGMKLASRTEVRSRTEARKDILPTSR